MNTHKFPKLISCSFSRLLWSCEASPPLIIIISFFSRAWTFENDFSLRSLFNLPSIFRHLSEHSFGSWAYYCVGLESESDRVLWNIISMDNRIFSPFIARPKYHSSRPARQHITKFCWDSIVPGYLLLLYKRSKFIKTVVFGIIFGWFQSCVCYCVIITVTFVILCV